ncbi:MAG: YggS family pyridoxal phosphate-dependent enzyme [Rickettsiales bacterium]|nr:YggS family pyridoxal phosphate-dependent enzyme [Rickettsiales bacterium]
MSIETKIKTVDNYLGALSERPLTANNVPKLIAISKRQPDDKIDAALAAGHRIFGENRLDEGIEHWKTRKNEVENLELHFVGALQSKKAADVVGFFDVIHSIDRESVASAVSKAMDKTGKRPDCFIQINTGEEPQKSGILPTDAAAYIKKCQKEWDLPIVGLMCLPPQGVNPVPHFAFLKKLANDHGLTQLSMGMSNDWELAVRMGATHIRLGTAVFGEREQK